MLDAKYFDEVLKDQLRIMEQPLRFTVHLTTGEEYMVARIVAAHESYVVLKVHSKGKQHEHTKRWQQANPHEEAVIFDQVCIPYELIAFTYLTARSTKGDDAGA